MPKETGPAFIRSRMDFGGVVGCWAGTDQRILVESFKPGFVQYLEKFAFSQGPVAGAGAGGTQTWMLRKGALAALLDTTVAADPAVGATNIKLTSVTGAVVGAYLTIETPDKIECRKITAVGTAGAGGTGVDVSKGFALDQANGATARVHTNPLLAAINIPLANATVGKYTESVIWDFLVAAGYADPSLVRMSDTDTYTIVRAAGGTAFTTEPSGTFSVTGRQRPQARA